MRKVLAGLLWLATANAIWGSTFTTVPVTCKEFPPNTSTETLTLDISGGTISAGTAADNCRFSLTGPALAQPFAAADLSYTSPADIVCWHTGGFCVSGPQLVTMTIAPVADGSLFTIVSASITTTFTLPSSDIGTPPSDVPEPGTLKLALAGFGLVCVGILRRMPKEVSHVRR